MNDKKHCIQRKIIIIITKCNNNNNDNDDGDDRLRVEHAMQRNMCL